MCGGGKDGKRDDQRDDKKGDEKKKDKEEQNKNPHHAYKDPNKTICIIFSGKVALETRRERKLTARAVMALANSNEKIANSKFQNWSHRTITFSRADQWAKILELGRFPLVLDPVIKNVWFKKVLIDGGSALDILFRNALTELGLKSEDLELYDAPF
jgi:hypothetical protein